MTTRTATVLLVEDDSVDQMAVQRAFQKAKIGNPILVAKDGIEALEMLRGEKGRARVTSPCLILLDLQMPRMNGIEFLTEIRKDPALRPLIVFVLTTSKDEEDRVNAYKFNVAGYIVKSDAGNGFLNLVTMLEHYWKIVELP